MEILPHLYPAIATVLKEARKASGLTQQQLADFAGLSRSYISFMECAERGMSVTAMYQIAKVLKIDGADFYSRIEKHINEYLENGPSEPEKRSGRPPKKKS